MATSERLEDKDVLLKEAAVALDLAQRREDATKLAFSMVEKGKIPPFESYDAFHEKVASLLEKDLRVVEEALSLDAEMPAFGKVASAPDEPVPAGLQAATASFYHNLTED